MITWFSNFSRVVGLHGLKGEGVASGRAKGKKALRCSNKKGGGVVKDFLPSISYDYRKKRRLKISF